MLRCKWLAGMVGLVMVLLGAVWFFQGIGMLGGSFMSGSVPWVAAGAALAVLGIGVAANSAVQLAKQARLTRLEARRA